MTEDLVVLVVSSDSQLLDEARFGYPEGVRIETARDAREAWTKMASVEPDVAVVDLHAGSAGGFSLAREMTHSTRLNSVPILIVLERDQDRWLAQQAGADSIKVKPLGVGELVKASLELAKSSDAKHGAVFPS